MSRWNLAPSLMGLAAVGLSVGCAQIVTFDEYTYDVDPCGPPPVSCDSGNELAYVLTSFDVARARAGRRDGFDLDATEEPICGQNDWTSPRGEAGIDNQLSGIIELYESLEGVNVGETAQADFLRGEGLVVIALRGVDSLENDDCVDLSSRTARVPSSLPLSSLDVDGDGVLDANLPFEVEAARFRDASACIIDGVIHARFGNALAIAPGLTGEIMGERLRARMAISSSGIDGVIGGALSLDGFGASVPEEIVEFLRGRADIGPSSPTARDCQSISFGVVFEGLPATIEAR